MSAARRKLGRPAGDRDRFGDFIKRAELDFRQARRAIAPRRPYNNGAREGKLAPRRHFAWRTGSHIYAKQCALLFDYFSIDIFIFIR
jgi:hypothetical protein